MERLLGRNIKKFDIIYMDDREKWNIGAKAVRIVQNGGQHPDTKFMPSHVGIVIEENNDIDKIKVIQSAISGVKIRELKLWTQNPECNIEVKRYKESLTQMQRGRLKTWLKSRLGMSYDYLVFIGIFVKYLALSQTDNPILQRIIKHFPNIFDVKVRYTCAELFAEAWWQCLGVSVWAEMYPSDISPYDEYRSKKFRTIGRHYNFQYAKEE